MYGGPGLGSEAKSCMANLVNVDKMRQIRDGQALSTLPLHIQVEVCQCIGIGIVVSSKRPNPKAKAD